MKAKKQQVQNQSTFLMFYNKTYTLLSSITIVTETYKHWIKNCYLSENNFYSFYICYLPG